MSRTIPHVPKICYYDSYSQMHVSTDGNETDSDSSEDYQSDDELSVIYTTPQVMPIDESRENVDPNIGATENKSAKASSSKIKKKSPPKPQNGTPKNSEKKLIQERKKMSVPKKKQLQKKFLKRKHSSSEKESVSKKHFKADVEDSEGNLVEDFEKNKPLVEISTPKDFAYDKPSTSKMAPNEEYMSWNEDPNVMSVEEIYGSDIRKNGKSIGPQLNLVPQYTENKHPDDETLGNRPAENVISSKKLPESLWKESSIEDYVSPQVESQDDAFAILMDKFANNDSNNSLSVENEEHQKFQPKIDNEADLSADDEADHVKKCNLLSNAFITKYKHSSDILGDSSDNTSSPERSTDILTKLKSKSKRLPSKLKRKKKLHREKCKEDPDYPKKLQTLRHMLIKEFSGKKKKEKSRKKSRKRVHLKTIPEEEPCELDSNAEKCAVELETDPPRELILSKDTSEKDCSSDNIPVIRTPKKVMRFSKKVIPKKKRRPSKTITFYLKKREKLLRKSYRKMHKMGQKKLAEPKYCNRHSALKRILRRFSRPVNPWSERVLDWLHSVRPELFPEPPESPAVDLSLIPTDNYYMDDVDNVMGVAAETCIAADDNDESEIPSPYNKAPDNQGEISDKASSESQSPDDDSADRQVDENQASDNPEPENQSSGSQSAVNAISDNQPYSNRSANRQRARPRQLYLFILR